jgi:hypothetical protein
MNKVSKLPEVAQKLELAERKVSEVTEVSKVKIAVLEQNVKALDQLNNELTSNAVVLEEKLQKMAEKLEDAQHKFSVEKQQLLEENLIKSSNEASSTDKVAVLERIASKLQERVNALSLSNANLEEAANERDSLRCLVELYQANLEKETAAKEELRRDVDNLKAEKSDVTKHMKFLEESHSTEVNALKKELEGLRMEHNNAKAAQEELENLQDMNADLKSKVKHLEQTNAYINMRLKHLSKKEAIPESPEKQLNSYIEVRQRMMDAVEKQVRDVQEKAHINRLHISEFTTKKPNAVTNADEERALEAIGVYEKLSKKEERDETANTRL